MRTAKYRPIAVFSMLAMALGLFPTLAAADSVSDVLTINGTAYTLIEPTSGPEATLTTPAIGIGVFVTPVSASLVGLQELDPVTGTPLFDSAGNPVISDYLQISVVQVGTFLSGPFQCSSLFPDLVAIANCISIHGTGNYFVPVPIYGYQFTLTSTSDPSGLPTLLTVNRSTTLPEGPSAVDLSSFTTGGQLSVTLQSVDTTSVPEPSSILLLGTGLLGLIGAIRKRRLA